MKKLATHLTILTLVVSLSACSTNTNQQNTAVGAGTGAVAGGLLGTLAKGAGSGWVIAGGAIVGALIGGVLGHSMDSTDDSHANIALENSIDHPSNWTNSRSGNWYKIVPTSPVMEYKGSSYCRHYIAYGKTTHGNSYRTKGVACKSADGLWHKIN